MKRSEYLHGVSAKLRRRLGTITSPGWADFEADVLDRLQAEAFAGLLMTPADDEVAVIGFQQRYKVAQDIRPWGNVEAVRSELIQCEDQLREITEGRARDEDNIPAQEPAQRDRFAFFRKMRGWFYGE